MNPVDTLAVQQGITAWRSDSTNSRLLGMMANSLATFTQSSGLSNTLEITPGAR
jgi:hypothetical protein